MNTHSLPLCRWYDQRRIFITAGEQEQCQHQRGRSSYEIQSREVWILGETSPENSIQERSSDESDYREPQAEGGQEQLSQWLIGAVHSKELGLSSSPTLLNTWRKTEQGFAHRLKYRTVGSETKGLGQFFVTSS